MTVALKGEPLAYNATVLALVFAAGVVALLLVLLAAGHPVEQLAKVTGPDVRDGGRIGPGPRRRTDR